MTIRSLAVLLVCVLASGGMLAGCGDDGDDDEGGPAQLATGMFFRTPSEVSTGWAGLFDVRSYARWQTLYRASEIRASGRITGLSIRYEAALASAATCTNVTVKLGHTVRSFLTTTFADNTGTGRGGQTTALSSGTVTFPADAAGTWHPIIFTTSFDYNGVDHLLVEFERTGSCSAYVYDGAEDRGDVMTVSTFTPAATTVESGGFVQNAKLTFAGGDSAIEFGGADSNYWPFTTETPHVQLLYRADEIDGSGPITGIGFKVQALTSHAAYTYTVQMAHTTKSALTTTFADNFDKGVPVTVARGTFTVPANVPAGSYIWIPCTGSFNYNGTDNLIVDIDVPSGSGNTYLMVAHTTPGRRAAGFHGDVAVQSLDDTTYDTKFRFHGGMIDVLTDGGSTAFLPFGPAEHIVQILYDQTLLGTGGKVSSLALRLASTSSATSYHDVRLIMGHRLASAPLGTTSLAANIDSDRATVFSGTVTVPAGLQGGDWITVPLASAFRYDASKHLVVQWDAPAYGVSNFIRGSSLSARYAGHVQGNIGSRTADVSNIAAGEYILDMRLVIGR